MSESTADVFRFAHIYAMVEAFEYYGYVLSDQRPEFSAARRDMETVRLAEAPPDDAHADPGLTMLGLCDIEVGCGISHRRRNALHGYSIASPMSDRRDCQRGIPSRGRPTRRSSVANGRHPTDSTIFQSPTPSAFRRSGRRRHSASSTLRYTATWRAHHALTPMLLCTHVHHRTDSPSSRALSRQSTPPLTPFVMPDSGKPSRPYRRAPPPQPMRRILRRPSSPTQRSP